MCANKNYGNSSHFILRLRPCAGMAHIEIEDNGPGMSDAVCKRIFEPFFSTKEIDIGTGLGLSVSYYIITENHRGTIKVESIPGQGTKFIIILPLASSPSRICNSDIKGTSLSLNTG